MMKTSYSTIFNEGLDFSTVLLDRDGKLIAEKNYTPSMMGAITYTVRWTLEELGAEYFQPGDVVVHNDPYRGNCHIPEHMMMKPIFRGGELVGFAGAIGHLAEVGGKAPGQLRLRRDRRLPGGPAPAAGEALRGRRVQRELWRIMLANHRTPRNTWGDLHAMIGALNVGERRLRRAVRALRPRTRCSRRGRGADRATPTGACGRRSPSCPRASYDRDDEVEDDGVGDRAVRRRGRGRSIRGGEVIVDFTGSDARRCAAR